MSKNWKRPGWKTYIVRGEITRLYKVGRSMVPVDRLRELQSNSPDMLSLCCVIDTDMERELHQTLKTSQHHGEWFTETPELLNIIRENSVKS